MYNIFPQSAKRVFCQTDEEVNNKIKQCTIENINKFIGADNCTLTERINELNSEWDTERILEASAASTILLISLIGICKKNKWFMSTGMIGCFLLNHALNGWCPPLPFIRNLGVRTQEEISNEKTAIKFLRGDFNNLNEDAEELINMLSKD